MRIPAVAVILMTATLRADEPVVTPTMELAKINREVREAYVDYNKKVKQGIEQPTAQKAFVEIAGPRYRRAIQLAEEHPKDPIALQALEYVLWAPFLTPETLPLVDRTYELLIERYALNKNLIKLCRISFRWDNRSTAPERFLRLVLDKNRWPDVRGIACLRLAEVLHDNAKLSKYMQDPEISERYAGRLSPEMFEHLKKLDAEKALHEADELLDRTIREFGELVVFDNQSLGDMAREKRADWREPKREKP